MEQFYKEDFMRAKRDADEKLEASGQLRKETSVLFKGT